MATVLEAIDEPLTRWLEAQPVVFVGTAPSSGGHLNLSPKGGDGTFRVLGSHRVGYVDLFGSGAETAAHLRDDGRIVVMACAFDGRPRIVRLHGRGQLHTPADDTFGGLLDRFALRDEQLRAVRGLVTVEVTRIADSCGYTVPTMGPAAERTQLYRTAEHKVVSDGPDAIAAYVAERNATSIDGLPAYPPPER